ncbi:hypothetical protein T11_583 [Trichinella zimbabwensis]|uniref:Uncharacterized protein n=1 Tax=Trichinella zimbabwensis TaxID=268475 RepID=A0A0V1I6N9_9BILA|nr:hypothetical protein T11_583 [Trichinella zimbabwensis]
MERQLPRLLGQTINCEREFVNRSSQISRLRFLKALLHSLCSFVQRICARLRVLCPYVNIVVNLRKSIKLSTQTFHQQQQQQQ